MTTIPPGQQRPPLSAHDGAELLRIARVTLTEYLATGRIPPGKPHKASLLATAAVFVTLRKDGALRGCIGTQGDDLPIYRAAQDMAAAAATRDPRFPPVTEDELAQLTIELSVLGARRPIAGPADVELGTDGVAIAAHGRRALLLPKVASEAGWDAATLIEQLCRKAGLPLDAWRDPEARLEAFAAQIFVEPSRG